MTLAVLEITLRKGETEFSESMENQEIQLTFIEFDPVFIKFNFAFMKFNF